MDFWRFLKVRFLYIEKGAPFPVRPPVLVTLALGSCVPAELPPSSEIVFWPMALLAP